MTPWITWVCVRRAGTCGDVNQWHGRCYVHCWSAVYGQVLVLQGLYKPYFEPEKYRIRFSKYIEGNRGSSSLLTLTDWTSRNRRAYLPRSVQPIPTSTSTWRTTFFPLKHNPNIIQSCWPFGHWEMWSYQVQLAAEQPPWPWLRIWYLSQSESCLPTMETWPG